MVLACEQVPRQGWCFSEGSNPSVNKMTCPGSRDCPAWGRPPWMDGRTDVGGSKVQAMPTFPHSLPQSPRLPPRTPVMSKKELTHTLTKLKGGDPWGRGHRQWNLETP